MLTGLVCIAAAALVLWRAQGSTAAAKSAVSVPVFGRSETLSLIVGRVRVRAKGSGDFLTLRGTILVPDGSEVDTTGGRVRVTVATQQPTQTADAEVYGGQFTLHQSIREAGETHFILSQPLAGCRPAPLPGQAARAHATAAASRHGHHSRTRHLWVSEHGGSWGTDGRYVSTTVEGTRWLIADACRRSEVKVTEGVVLVHDLIHHTTVFVTAGHEYVVIKSVGEGAGFLPPRGKVLTGESGGDPGAFQRQVGKHVAVFGYFGSWGHEFAPLLAYVKRLHARLLLHLSTDVGYGSDAQQSISPAAIARGQGDGFLVSLCEELATSQDPVYVALLPEMNQANNAYSAFNPNGSSRGPANSTSAYRQAWRRAVLIVRGGVVSTIDRRLRALHLPPLDTTLTTLPRPKVAFMWAPQTAGTPETAANAPAAYYPGSAYVDIVGTDFYSAFPNFRGLESLYSAYPSKPFGFNEWAMWKSGDPGFVRQLFAFVRSHRRVGLMVYNEGLSPNGPFRLERFPAARAELRRRLRSSRFPGYPAE